jgi:hypothetical protein
MTWLKLILRFLLWVVGLLVLGVLSLYLLFYFIPPFSGYDLILERLLFGFVSFCDGNVSAISWNARTWGPGLGAFLIALVFSHRYLSKWAERTGRRWSFLTSFCLLMIVPVLFVISFIVPGVLLQWEVLRETGWIDIR